MEDLKSSDQIFSNSSSISQSPVISQSLSSSPPDYFASLLKPKTSEMTSSSSKSIPFYFASAALPVANTTNPFNNAISNFTTDIPLTLPSPWIGGASSFSIKSSSSSVVDSDIDVKTPMTKSANTSQSSFCKPNKSTSTTNPITTTTKVPDHSMDKILQELDELANQLLEKQSEKAGILSPNLSRHFENFAIELRKQSSSIKSTDLKSDLSSTNSLSNVGWAVSKQDAADLDLLFDLKIPVPLEEKQEDIITYYKKKIQNDVKSGLSCCTVPVYFADSTYKTIEWSPSIVIQDVIAYLHYKLQNPDMNVAHCRLVLTDNVIRNVLDSCDTIEKYCKIVLSNNQGNFNSSTKSSVKGYFSSSARKAALIVPIVPGWHFEFEHHAVIEHHNYRRGHRKHQNVADEKRRTSIDQVFPIDLKASDDVSTTASAEDDSKSTVTNTSSVSSRTTRLGLFSTLRVPQSAPTTTLADVKCEPTSLQASLLDMQGSKKVLNGLHVTSLKSSDRRQILQTNMMRVKLYFTDPREPIPLDFEKLVRSKLNVFGKRGVFSRSSSFTGLLVSQTKAFGVCLQTYMDQQALKKPDLKVPDFFEKLCQQVEQHGLETDGIFRIPGSVKNVKAAKDFIDKTGNLPDLSSLSIHDCTALIKMFLRELPEPILTNRMYQYYLAAAKLSSYNHPDYYLQILQFFTWLLPNSHIQLLERVLAMLKMVSEANVANRMTVSNLAVVLGPNILFSTETNTAVAGGIPNSSNPGMGITNTAGMSAAALASAASSSKEEYSLIHNVVKTMIEHNEQLFQIPVEFLPEKDEFKTTNGIFKRAGQTLKRLRSISRG